MSVMRWDQPSEASEHSSLPCSHRDQMMILPSARRKNRYLAVQKIGRPHPCFAKMSDRRYTFSLFLCIYQSSGKVVYFLRDNNTCLVILQKTNKPAFKKKKAGLFTVPSEDWVLPTICTAWVDQGLYVVIFFITFFKLENRVILPIPRLFCILLGAVDCHCCQHCNPCAVLFIWRHMRVGVGCFFKTFPEYKPINLLGNQQYVNK